MINKNNEKFFSDLEKELPSSPYTERFKEELAQHMEDEVETITQKGTDKTSAEAEAIRKIGTSSKLTQAYIKRIRPDLLLAAYFESLVVATMATIFCLGYFFLFLNNFFSEKASGWEEWVIGTVIPFLLFLTFYLLSLTSSFKKNITTLRAQLIGIIYTLPFVAVLSAAFFIQAKAKPSLDISFIPYAILVLIVNYTAFAFAAYILTRGFKKLSLFPNNVGRYFNYLLIIVAELYLTASSLSIYLYPNAEWLLSFLKPRLLIDSYIETGLGIATPLPAHLMLWVWVYGLSLIALAALCLARLVVYIYSRKSNSGIRFPGFTLILFSYIVSLLITPAIWQINEVSVGWQRPAANVIDIIEKKQTGPFYRWFLKSFKHQTTLSYGVNILNNKFIFFLADERPDSVHSIVTIKSVREFNIEVIPLTNSDILQIQQRTTPPPSVLPTGFACTPPPITEAEKLAFISSGFNICTSLTYNGTPILSGKTPYVISSIAVDNQQKWSLIELRAYSQSGLYLIQLP
jgi:hypothetical protein